MPNREMQFSTECEEAKKLFLQKNAEYGDSIRFGGVLSACYNIVGPAMRLIPLVFQSEKHGENKADTVFSILQDIHNYAVIGMFFIREDNWFGDIK